MQSRHAGMYCSTKIVGEEINNDDFLLVFFVFRPLFLLLQFFSVHFAPFSGREGPCMAVHILLFVA